jgi:hypothetical protein
MPEVRIALTRTSGQNQRAFFADSLLKTDWRSLYHLKSCEEQLKHLYDTIDALLNTHMPMKLTKKCSTDKPWITPHFKDLLKQRQMAYSSGNLDLYKHLRNKANRVSKNLRSRYYQTKIDELKSTNSKKWWS